MCMYDLRTVQTPCVFEMNMFGCTGCSTEYQVLTLVSKYGVRKVMDGDFQKKGGFLRG